MRGRALDLSFLVMIICAPHWDFCWRMAKVLWLNVCLPTQACDEAEIPAGLKFRTIGCFISIMRGAGQCNNAAR